MGKITNRALALGFLVAVSAGLALPCTAAADTDPALAGDCGTTLGADSGQALTLDAGAPVDQPGVLAVGTGSNSANDPSLHLDVADAAQALNLSTVPGTGTVEALCANAQGAVNTLSAATQNLLGGTEPAPSPPLPGESPQPPTTPAPTAPGDSVPPANPGSVQFESFPLDGTSPLSGTDLSSLIAPVAMAPAPNLAPPTGTSPGLTTQDSGTAQALPVSSMTPAKLPLLLAAIALALAAAGLTHTWLRRRPA